MVIIVLRKIGRSFELPTCKKLLLAGHFYLDDDFLPTQELETARKLCSPEVCVRLFLRPDPTHRKPDLT